MYYAGLEDVFHQPHSYYFSRYPAVIESTIFYPSLDMKFRNDSPHSVLIDTSYTDTSITVTFWGTKRYDISTEWGPRRNVTSPQTIHLEPARAASPPTASTGSPRTPGGSSNRTARRSSGRSSRTATGPSPASSAAEVHSRTGGDGATAGWLF